MRNEIKQQLESEQNNFSRDNDNNEYAKAIENKEEEEGEEEEFEIDFNEFYNDPLNWEPDFINLNESSKQFIDKCLEDYNNNTKNNLLLLTQLSIIKLFDVDLETLGLDTNIKKLAFFIQSYLKNSDYQREFAIKNRSLIDPFDPEESKLYLKKLFADVVNKTKNVEKQKIDLEYTMPIEERANIFAETNDIYVAVASIKGTTRGKDMHHFFKKLQIVDCPLAIEKLKMLIEGKYESIILFEDHNGKPQKFSTQNCHKFWIKNFIKLKNEEWKQLFDKYNCKHNVYTWFNRLDNSQKQAYYDKFSEKTLIQQIDAL